MGYAILLVINLVLDIVILIVVVHILARNEGELPMKTGLMGDFKGYRRDTSPLDMRKKKGSIYIPPSDVETAREAIIEKNREQGKDTPISELTPE